MTSTDEESLINEAWNKLTPDEQSFWKNKGRDFKEHYSKYYLNLRDANYTLSQQDKSRD